MRACIFPEGKTMLWTNSSKWRHIRTIPSLFMSVFTHGLRAVPITGVASKNIHFTANHTTNSSYTSIFILQLALLEADVEDAGMATFAT